ncbi:MAG: hypothetical protein GX130_12650 [Candidatus Hydrogenedens sp.]|jgi:hypothetical protein|nr:hypothetical protein [Candidatus Hydrogenedens sp.]
MDFYIELFSPLFPHFKEYGTYYIIGVPVLLTAIYFSRRYSVPAILFSLEFSLYTVGMHTVVHVLVRLFAWFKNSSSMKALQADGTRLDPEAWTTPWKNFWEWDIYDPEWIPYMEGAFIVVIILLMARYRPFRPTNKRRRRYVPPPKPVNSDDNWGVPKQYYGLPSAGTDKKRRP